MQEPDRGRPGTVGSTPSSVRISNLALVLKSVLESTEPISRAGVASLLGMTRSTVSRLVDELVAAKFLSEGSPTLGARGRPGVPLTAGSGSLMSLGMEINADRLSSTLADLSGRTIAAKTLDFDVAAAGSSESFEKLEGQALDVLASLPKGARIIGAHLAIPGLVNRAGTTIVRAPNLGWGGLEPANHLGGLLADLDCDFRVSNDVDCAALAFMRHSPEQLRDNGSFIYVTGEVGIGSSVVIDGRQMTGRHGWASELGHVCVVSNSDRVCGCGATGCLETVIGRPGLLTDSATSSIAALVEALDSGDARALEAIDDAARALGRALGAALNLLDLGQVVLGGHLETLAQWLLPPLRKELAVRVLWSPHEEIEIITVGHDPTRTALGAAFAAMLPVISDPGTWIDIARWSQTGPIHR